MIRLLNSILLVTVVTVFGTDASKASSTADRNACDLLSKEQVEQATGLVINNVAFRDHGVFTTCSFETEDWQETIGLIYFPGLGTPANAASLAEQVKQDLEKDQVPYTNLEADSGIGDAAVFYQTDDGKLYTVVAHRGGHRVIISARTRAAASTMAGAALSSTK